MSDNKNNLFDNKQEEILIEDKEDLKKKPQKQKKFKRNLCFALVIALMVSIIGASLAYFTDNVVMSTTGSVGTLAVEIENNINLLDSQGRDILNPGDLRNVDFTVVNMGNKSIDARTTVALSLYDYAGHPMNFSGTNTTQSEYDLYKIDDVQLIEGYGYVPKDGATPLESKEIIGGKIFYTLETSLNGNASMYDEAELIEGIDKYEKDYSYVLIFKAEAGNKFQDSTIIIDILTEAKQHENTGDNWEFIGSERFGQGAINKDVAPFEHIITDYYYPFVVGYNADGKMTLVDWQDGVDPQSFTDITVPYGVEVIPDYFFEWFTNIEWMQLPETVTYIGDGAFSLCVNMKYINLPENLTYIGPMAFLSCVKLTEIVVPEGITTLEEWTFKNCEKLKYVTLPSTLKTIKNSNFEECLSLEEIYIPDSVEAIDYFTFRYCDSLVSIHLPENENYTVLSDEVLAFCPSLKKLNIPNSIKVIEGEPIWYTDLEHLAVGSGIEEVGDLILSSHKIENMTLYTDNQKIIDYFENSYHFTWNGNLKPYVEYPYFN